MTLPTPTRRRRPATWLLLAAVAAAPAGSPPAVGDAAPDFTLTELGGAPVQLSKLTAAGPVVLVVLRGYPGYQCPICTRQFGDYMGHAAAFQKTGAQLVFVYPGPAADLKQHAAEFVNDRNLPADFHFALDPDFTFTNAYGLRWDADQETSYPSTFVIDAHGKVTFAKVSHAHGDRTTAADALAALGAG